MPSEGVLSAAVAQRRDNCVLYAAQDCAGCAIEAGQRQTEADARGIECDLMLASGDAAAGHTASRPIG